MQIGDKWYDEDGIEWTVTTVSENAFESIGSPLPNKTIDMPVANLEDRIVVLEGTIEEIVVALNDKGLIP
jgi:hypothetical protein